MQPLKPTLVIVKKAANEILFDYGSSQDACAEDICDGTPKEANITNNGKYYIVKSSTGVGYIGINKDDLTDLNE